MAIKKIGMTCLTVSNFADSRRFFIETLGLTETSGSPDMSWMELTAGDEEPMLGVGAANPEHGPSKAGTNGVVSFLVDNVVSEKAELEKKGVKFIGEIMEVPGHVKLASFADPDQNAFFLVEDLSGN